MRKIGIAYACIVAEEQRSLQLAAREAYVDTKEAAGFRPAAKEEPL